LGTVVVWLVHSRVAFHAGSAVGGFNQFKSGGARRWKVAYWFVVRFTCLHKSALAWEADSFASGRVEIELVHAARLLRDASARGGSRLVKVWRAVNALGFARVLVDGCFGAVRVGHLAFVNKVKFAFAVTVRKVGAHRIRMAVVCAFKLGNVFDSTEEAAWASANTAAVGLSVVFKRLIAEDEVARSKVFDAAFASL
jgi:hypothetical protein